MVDKRAFETNSSDLHLKKILVTINQCQRSLLSGWMKATVTSSNETWVERLTNNVVFQFRRTLDSSPNELAHYGVGPLVGKTLLLRLAR